MKKPYQIVLDVMAYSQQDAEARVEMLLQVGAFVKDFNIENLAGSMVKSFIASTVGKMTSDVLQKENKSRNKSLVAIGLASISKEK